MKPAENLTLSRLTLAVPSADFSQSLPIRRSTVLVGHCCSFTRRVCAGNYQP